MLRIESNLLRMILLAAALIGIILFLLPMFVHIVNIGNLFGLGCSVFLLCFVIFNRWIADFLGRADGYKAGRITMRVIAVLFVLGVLYCIVISCSMLHAAYKKPKEPPQAMIVLGCKVCGTVPSLMLSSRIRAAYSILEANPEMPVIVSGGKGSDEEISEAQCMYNELTRMGISAARIIMEDKSTTTSENLRFSKEILAERGITGTLYLATDGYHEMRAQILAQKEGLPKCEPASADTLWYLLPTYWVREWFGLTHAFVFGN